MSTSWTGHRVWIVGASRGIGAAIAHELRDAGATVAISARDAEALDEVAGGRMTTAPADVTDRAGVAAAAAAITAEIGQIDTVIFSAGYWKRTDALRWDADAYERHVQVNLLGFNNVIAAVLPDMVSRGSGRIAGIASVAGYRGLPGSEAYGATKAAQINQLEAMRTALASSGVDVVTVCPGFVRTEMTEGNSFPMPFLIDPDEAARAIRSGLESERQEIVFPLPMAITMKVARLIPVRAWSWLARPRKQSTTKTPQEK
jgi:short-subunit dehydrogenase